MMVNHFFYKMFGDSISNTPPQPMIWDLMIILTIVMSSWFVETRLNKIIINVHCLLSWRLYRFSKWIRFCLSLGATYRSANIRKNPWVRETFWSKPWLRHSRAKSRMKNMGFQTKWTIHFIGLNPQFCFPVDEYLSFAGTECSKRRSSKRGDTLNISNPGPPGKKYLQLTATMTMRIWVECDGKNMKRCFELAWKLSGMSPQ